MKNYNKLKEIIQEANPEIMELKFGCEILLESPNELESYEGGFKRPKHTGNTNFYDAWTLVGIERNSHGTQDYRYYFTVGSFGYSNSLVNIDIEPKLYKKMLDLGKIKILGRPIQLADVLMAIGGEYNPKNTSTFLNIDSNGEFCWTTTTNLRGGTMEIIEPIISWNLSKNLDNQTDEVKEFLIGLLVNNKEKAEEMLIELLSTNPNKEDE